MRSRRSPVQSLAPTLQVRLERQGSAARCSALGANHERFRPRHRRGRHQRRRHRPRCGRARPARAAGRAERPRVGDVVGLHQADPWRAALSRARLAAAGARGADRARGPAADGAAPDPADAVRAAGRARDAPALDAAARPVRLRPSRRPQAPAANQHHRSHARCARRPAEGALRARLRILRLLGRRRAAGGAQRASTPPSAAR